MTDDDPDLWVHVDHTPGPELQRVDHDLPPMPPRQPLGFTLPGRHRRPVPVDSPADLS